MIIYNQMTLSRDEGPGHFGKHEGSVVNLIINIFILIERKSTTQTVASQKNMRNKMNAHIMMRAPDVENDSYRPHVKGAVVAFVLQNFRSCSNNT